MHEAAYRFVQRHAAEALGDNVAARVLEIGARNINGSVRPLFHGAALYVGLDVKGGPDVDVVADGATYQHEHRFDIVVCCEVLEHAEQAEAIVANAIRHLSVGGTFLMTCAGHGRPPHSAFDGGSLRGDEFYRNVTAEMFTAWVERIKDEYVFVQVIETNERDRDLYAVVRRIA